MSVKDMIEDAGKWIDHNSPVILLTVGIVGFVTTTVIAVKATPKAEKRLKEAKKDLDIIQDEQNDAEQHNAPVEEIKKIKTKKVKAYGEVAKDLAIIYGPTMLLGASSAACLIRSHNIEAKRLTAVGTALQISEVARKEYRDKVIETIGKGKEQEIQDEIAKDHVKANPPDINDPITMSEIDTLCYETLTGRYFRSNGVKLKKIENEINRRLRNEGFISANEWFYELGLPSTKVGDDLGWNYNEELDLRFSSMLHPDYDVPILIVDYAIAPKYDYRAQY